MARAWAADAFCGKVLFGHHTVPPASQLTIVAPSPDVLPRCGGASGKSRPASTGVEVAFYSLVFEAAVVAVALLRARTKLDAPSHRSHIDKLSDAARPYDHSNLRGRNTCYTRMEFQEPSQHLKLRTLSSRSRTQLPSKSSERKHRPRADRIRHRQNGTLSAGHQVKRKTAAGLSSCRVASHASERASPQPRHS
jgi:hypothetical protein